MAWWIWVVSGFVLLCVGFAATTMDVGLFAIGAFVSLNLASSAADVRAAMARIHAPVLGMVYAGDDGTIGYAAAGSVPIRGGEHGAAIG
jgi:penicillin amidase